jgi:hypothetical protein
MMSTRQQKRKKLIHALAVMWGAGWGGGAPEVEDDEEELGLEEEEEEEDGLGAEEEDEEGLEEDEEDMSENGRVTEVEMNPRKAMIRTRRARGWRSGLGPAGGEEYGT